MLRHIIMISFVFMAIWLPSEAMVAAESDTNSVKACIDNPDTCADSQEKESQQEQVEGQSSAITAGDVVKMIFAFLFVIGLLVVVLKIVNGKGKLLQRNKIVQNLGGTSVGSNKSIQVVKVGNQLFVVGVGENVQLLSEVVGDEKQQLLVQYEQEQNTDAEYQAFLPALFDKWKQPKSEEASRQFQHVFRSELKNIIKKRKAKLEELERNKQHDE
ncbi:flagellar biosynthesis protein FliZ [Priestia megaterium]|nr:flagellar biosynthesis protein FliZ [Priestia megaterium]